MNLKSLNDLADDLILGMNVSRESKDELKPKLLWIFEQLITLDVHQVLSGNYHNSPMSILNRYSVRRLLEIEKIDFTPKTESN